MKKILIPVVFVAVLASCSKKDRRLYSAWYVNGDYFVTNEVKTDVGKAIAHIYTNSRYSGGSLPYGFSITFNKGSLPSAGSFRLGCGMPYTCMSFLYKDKVYMADSAVLQYLQAGYEYDRSRYTLDTTWFYNSADRLDSVYVYGTFNEP